MIIQWFRHIIGRVSNEALAKQAIDETEQHKVEREAVDVAHQAMREEAKRRATELDGLVRSGWPAVQRERIRRRVRQKVGEIVGGELAAASDEMVDEITERIVDAAEVDPFYATAFETQLAENDK